MTQQENIDFLLHQAIHKTQEAYQSLNILAENAPYLAMDAYTSADGLVKKALSMLLEADNERARVVLRAKAKKIAEERLCKELGISLNHEELV